ncbi:MAG: GAF domain-containing protein [Proteobacteria bacterium]|nr:GAF domain-containing protein [Pseudomonadota bacterium]
MGPAFGEADLSNCEREQIHLAGSIQPHGALLHLSRDGNVIVQTSANAASFLALPDTLIGRTLADIPGDLAASLRPHLNDPLTDVARGVRCSIGEPPRMFDGLIHRPSGGGLIVELEPAGPVVDLSSTLDSALQAIMAAGTIRGLGDETARIVKAITGYDRVMVYRFDEHGHGEVMSEAREPHLEAFLGNHYPASDIPQIARRLYERNRVRLLVDVDFAPVPLTPVLSPLTGDHLDMSLCFLRSSSPIHVQYLKNMGVRATLVVSLLVSGRLWGLISCHHYEPRFIHFETRAVTELLAEAVATRIAALESFAHAQAELSVRRLEQRMIRAISQEGDWRGALFDGSRALLEPVQATGAALLFENEVRTVGDVPSTADLRELGRWLDSQPREGVLATATLPDDAPDFTPLTPIASGLLAVPVSTGPGEYLIWLRPERVRTVTWGGNPFKPVSFGDDPKTLSPRRSFAQWHQLVEGTSDAWSESDQAAARLIGESVSDVIMQFRAVRMLFAQDQLEQVRREVQAASQPVVIASTDGHILKMNAAFEALLPKLDAPPAHLNDLLPLWAEQEEAESRLRDLLREHKSWRGEVAMIGPGGGTTPLLIRADPVFTAPNRTLGVVLMVTDLTERKAAETARRRFQEVVLQQGPTRSGQLDTGGDLVFRNLLAKVVENAQLAALEITDRIDTTRMPEMLEAIRASVARTAEVLRYLVWHATSWGRDRNMLAPKDRRPGDKPTLH